MLQPLTHLVAAFQAGWCQVLGQKRLALVAYVKVHQLVSSLRVHKPEVRRWADSTPPAECLPCRSTHLCVTAIACSLVVT